MWCYLPCGGGLEPNLQCCPGARLPVQCLQCGLWILGTGKYSLGRGAQPTLAVMITFIIVPEYLVSRFPLAPLDSGPETLFPVPPALPVHGAFHTLAEGPSSNCHGVSWHWI